MDVMTSEVKRMQLFKAPQEQLVLERGDFRAVIAPERGGRVVELSHGGQNAFHRLYPDGFEFGPYKEYGGLEEHVGSAPGSVWNAEWHVESVNGSAALAAYSNKTLVRKHFSLEEGDVPLLRIDYELTNYDPNFARFTFGIHPELTLDGDHKRLQYHVPLDGRIESGGYTEAGFRKYVTPQEGWSAATADEKLFLQILPPGVTDCLEIYYPKVNTHLVLQPVVFGVGLSPERTVRFPYFLYFGPGDVNRAEEIYASLLPRLQTEYFAAGPQPELPQMPRKNGPGENNFNFQEGFERAMKDEGRGRLGFFKKEEKGREREERNRERERERQRREQERERERNRLRQEREAERGRRREERGDYRDLHREGRAWPHFDAPFPPEPFEGPIQPVPPVPPKPPAPALAGHSDLKEERLLILKGVAEGKYSVDDALRLMDQLEKMNF